MTTERIPHSSRLTLKDSLKARVLEKTVPFFRDYGVLPEYALCAAGTALKLSAWIWHDEELAFLRKMDIRVNPNILEMVILWQYDTRAMSTMRSIGKKKDQSGTV
jgi:hypothetical protein